MPHRTGLMRPQHRIFPKIYLLVLVALVAISALCAGNAQAGSPRPERGFVKLSLSEKESLWLELEPERMRFGKTSGALRQADWIRFKYDKVEKSAASPRMTLHLKEETSPPWQKVELRVVPFADFYILQWRLTILVKDKTRWSYWLEESVLPKLPPKKIPEIKLPDLSKTKVTFDARSQQGYDSRKKAYPAIGMAVRIFSGDRAWDSIEKDGQVVLAHLEVREASGRLVEEMQKPLYETGFT